ncbi:MAG TPA: hypothetical protein VHD62_01525 [Opitutaceae bacterium]|nr:hypothetical protein [Opitutaceae bacterium]
MKINLPQRQRTLAIIAGAAVALYILDAAVIEPLRTIWQLHSTEIARLQTSVNNGRNLIARAAQLDRVWGEMQANALPKDPAQAEQDVISAFDRWGRANNIELASIRPQWKRGATDRYSLLECRVDATGTLATLSHFLYELERSPLALRVDSVELTSRDESGQKLSLGLIVSGLRLSPLERKTQ